MKFDHGMGTEVLNHAKKSGVKQMEIFRRDEFEKAPTNVLIRGIAKHLGGGTILRDDKAPAIDDDNTIAATIQNGAEALFILLQMLLRWSQKIGPAIHIDDGVRLPEGKILHRFLCLSQSQRECNRFRRSRWNHGCIGEMCRCHSVLF